MTFSEAIGARVDGLLESLHEGSDPGCAVAIVHEGSRIYSRGVGQAHLEWDSPITDRTRFHLASLSKHFTAFAIAMLADRGLVDLGAPARTYLPQMPDLDLRVTVQHLVHHTHGLPDQWELAMLAGWRMDDVVTTDDVTDLLRHQHAVHSEPGETYCYGNTGYTLLALIVQTVTGLSVRGFCEQEIFAPLGMTDTYFNDNYTEVAPRRAASYACVDGVFRHRVLSFSIPGATNLVSSTRDLAIWTDNFVSGTIGGSRVLDMLSTVATLNSGRKTPYGFGLMFDSHRGQDRVYHGGGDAGFTSMMIRFPAHRFAVVALSNTREIPAPTLGDRIADIVLDELGVSPAPPLEPISERAREDFTGLFIHAQTGLTVRLEDRAGTLTYVEGDRAIPTVQIGDTRLALPRYVEAELVQDDNGTPVLDTWSYAGPGFRYVRAQPAEPADLRDFTGRYRNSALNSECTISLRDGRLWVRRRKAPDIRLLPTAEDSFDGTWDDAGSLSPFSFKFARAGDHVIGFAHSFPRTHGIWFDRAGH